VTRDDDIRSKHAALLAHELWSHVPNAAAADWVLYPGISHSEFSAEHDAWLIFLATEPIRRLYSACVDVRSPDVAPDAFAKAVFDWQMNPRKVEPVPFAWPVSLDDAPHHRARAVLALAEREKWAYCLSRVVREESAALAETLRRESFFFWRLLCTFELRGVVYRPTEAFAYLRFLDKMRLAGFATYPAPRSPSMTKILRTLVAEPDVPLQTITAYRALSKAYYTLFAPYTPDPSGIETERGLTDVLVKLDKKFGIRNRRPRNPGGSGAARGS
jgi:hypothetical protein